MLKGKFWTFIILVIICGFVSCTKNEVKLSFALPQSVNATYLLLYYASDSRQGMIREDVAVVQHGRGEIVCQCVNPTLIYFFEGSRRLPVVVYAEKGDKITIDSKSANSLDWIIKGDKINDELTSFRIKNKKSFEAHDALVLNKAVSAFVKENPESGASALVLLVYYDRSVDAEGFERCWKMLKGDAAESRWRELVGRSDMINGYEPVNHAVKNPVFKTYGTGMDTVKTLAAPAIFYFANLSAESRRDDIKMLRELIKARGDSSSRLVVEVSLEPDSSSWNYRVPQDSLQGAVRAWMPKSFSDSLATEFSLAEQPWFVVTQKGGKIVYAGSDSEKASTTFRDIK